ncbi:MAG TPA: hypothetical protein VK921_16040 [Anditalea sp.]|nr:hypothetical protein [Anditalea sp.]
MKKKIEPALRQSGMVQATLRSLILHAGFNPDPRYGTSYDHKKTIINR